MQHHYKNGDIGYGVSSKFWDYVFGTEIPGV
jgi:4-hydroxysphinganine ceramide fatty acyl 2-hydroxylase